MTEMTSASFQAMTELPLEQERALLDIPMAILLRKCRVPSASDKYLLIRMIIDTHTPKQLAAFVASKWTAEDVAAAEAALGSQKVPALAPVRGKEKVLKAPRAPKEGAAPATPGVRTGRLADSDIVHVTAGNTRIQEGSLRARVIDALELATTRSKTVAELTAVLGQDTRPVIAKLRAAGWCEINP